jgi:hypothetical protein
MVKREDLWRIALPEHHGRSRRGEERSNYLGRDRLRLAVRSLSNGLRDARCSARAQRPAGSTWRWVNDGGRSSKVFAVGDILAPLSEVTTMEWRREELRLNVARRRRRPDQVVDEYGAARVGDTASGTIVGGAFREG